MQNTIILQKIQTTYGKPNTAATPAEQLQASEMGCPSSSHKQVNSWLICSMFCRTTPLSYINFVYKINILILNIKHELKHRNKNLTLYCAKAIIVLHRTI